jgi:hypothetical protein
MLQYVDQVIHRYYAARVKSTQSKENLNRSPNTGSSSLSRDRIADDFMIIHQDITDVLDSTKPDTVVVRNGVAIFCSRHNSELASLAVQVPMTSLHREDESLPRTVAMANAALAIALDAGWMVNR